MIPESVPFHYQQRREHAESSSNSAAIHLVHKMKWIDVFDQAWPTKFNRVESNFCWQFYRLWTGTTVICGYLGSKRGRLKISAKNKNYQKIIPYTTTGHEMYKFTRFASESFPRRWRYFYYRHNNNNSPNEIASFTPHVPLFILFLFFWVSAAFYVDWFARSM